VQSLHILYAPSSTTPHLQNFRDFHPSLVGCRGGFLPSRGGKSLVPTSFFLVPFFLWFGVFFLHQVPLMSSHLSSNVQGHPSVLPPFHQRFSTLRRAFGMASLFLSFLNSFRWLFFPDPFRFFRPVWQAFWRPAFARTFSIPFPGAR